MKFYKKKKKNVKLEGCDKMKKFENEKKKKKKIWLQPGSNRGRPHGTLA